MNQSLLFAEADAAQTVSVLVPYPVERAYSYTAPAGLPLQPGDYVTVPLGNREVPGVVWDPAENDEAVASKKLKAVVTRHDVPPMPAVHRQFLNWVAHYNMAPLGFVLKMSLPVFKALEPPEPITAYVTGITISEKTAKGLSPQRQDVLKVMADGLARRASEIAELAGCTAGVVRGMADAGILRAVHTLAAAPCSHPDIHRAGVSLSAAQEGAAKHLRQFVDAGGYHAALLDGVTGAGKTEVYFEGVAEALKKGKQVLILLPEIALSNAFLDRFRARFGCNPALWHSSLTPAQRRNTWRGVAEGQTRVVVGARSALFLPYMNLGFIVVDEEHDSAYKQEDGVIYHARDMAVVRAHQGKIPIVLVSATPSLETMTNVWSGKYHHLHLPDRHGGAQLPDIHIVDMKLDKPEKRHFIAPSLRLALEENLKQGGQSLLFLNRRGYAPLTICRTCGHRMNCPRCTAWLVEHKRDGRLTCHHCGYGLPLPKICTACGDKDSLNACGPGVERILEEVKSYFPEARTVVLASDTAGTHEELATLLQDIREHKYDIIVGTQIIAKGHHFPKLTLVGVVDGDLGLQGGDLRAAEHTFQLLHQVAGRAGREEMPGHVYLQTFLPNHKVIQALSTHDRDR
ncbi:MAG TPA: primosomal protein N', partial [Patescibacteria group bacterium]|nr:primosomal protein N' [Patescibacteria group bacterium]